MSYMENRIDKLVRRPNCYRIYFQCDNYGNTYFQCYLEANAYQRSYGIGDSMEAALDQAENMLEELRPRGRIKYPADSDQPNEGGYSRYMLDEINQIEFKRFARKFYVTQIGQPKEGDEYV